MCATKEVPNRYISNHLRYILDIFHAPPPRKKEPTSCGNYFVPFWNNIVSPFSVQCVTGFSAQALFNFIALLPLALLGLI